MSQTSPKRYIMCYAGKLTAFQVKYSSLSSGVSWGVHSVRLHPGGSKRGAKKEVRKRKKQGKGEKIKGKEKGRQRRREGKGKKICKRKEKEGRNQKKIGYKK